ncbi:MAG: DUF1735 and LamG domain-containing protein [Tannerellaceae bacterium]|nr:DUF1735 and LamG domain-containing protein [Tannerellaceae bacterium]
MRKYSQYIALIACFGFILSACDRIDESESAFDNVVYVENAKTENTELLMLKATALEEERVLKAALALPETQDIEVTFKADFSVVDQYNEANYTETQPLPAEHYSFSTQKATIPAGNVVSSEVVITFTNLGSLPQNISYILPVTLESATNVSILNGSKTLYYIIRKGAIITTAAFMGENHFEFPTMKTSEIMDGFTHMTWEGLVNPHVLEKTVNTFMGVEGYCLIRFGDISFEPNRAQLAGPGNYLSNLLLRTNRWQHVAMTFDVEAGEVKFYLDGVEVPPSDDNAPSYSGNKINFGPDGANNDPFYIGKSFNDERYFEGEMCEFRIWNVVRTQEEIAGNMYEVDADSEGLVAYWKMDEGEGRTIKDYTGNGLDGVAGNNVKWTTVELPVANED